MEQYTVIIGYRQSPPSGGKTFFLRNRVPGDERMTLQREKVSLVMQTFVLEFNEESNS